MTHRFKLTHRRYTACATDRNVQNGRYPSFPAVSDASFLHFLGHRHLERVPPVAVFHKRAETVPFNAVSAVATSHQYPGWNPIVVVIVAEKMLKLLAYETLKVLYIKAFCLR